MSGRSVEEKNTPPHTTMKPVLKDAAAGVRGSLADYTVMGRCPCRCDFGFRDEIHGTHAAVLAVTVVQLQPRHS